MKKLIVRWTAVAAACCGMMTASLPISAATPVAVKAPAATDVSLAAGGTLSGKVVDENGFGVDGAAVSVHRGELEVAQAVADESGAFTVQGLRGGTYQISGGQGQGVYRLWSANTAPPAAQPQAVLVSSTQMVRGQTGAELDPVAVIAVVGAGFGVAGTVVAISSHSDAEDAQGEADRQARINALQQQQIQQLQNRPASPR